jgi:LacI family transcriptional regulator
MPSKPVTLLDLARRLGVSKATVSLALRGKPGMSEELRAQILAEAQRSGYRPNPVAVELMSIIQSQRHATGVETIAYLNTYRDPDFYRKVYGLMDFFTGARDHAAQFGYTVEFFDMFALRMTTARLVNILKARGVRGILVGPRWREDPDFDFPWDEFSAVLVGQTECRHRLYRVCLTTLRTLVARGYRRIGLALDQDDEYLRSGGEMFMRSCPPGVAMIPRIFEGDPKVFAEDWIVKNQLDAVVSLQSGFAEIVPGMKTKEGAPIGYANLCIPPGKTWSGIQQHLDKIGAESVNLLRSLLLSGTRGEANYHRVLLIEGEWVDGSTTRPLKQAMAPKTSG